MIIIGLVEEKVGVGKKKDRRDKEGKDEAVLAKSRGKEKSGKHNQKTPNS